jgi:hypothetical protein
MRKRKRNASHVSNSKNQTEDESCSKNKIEDESSSKNETEYDVCENPEKTKRKHIKQNPERKKVKI